MNWLKVLLFMAAIAVAGTGAYFSVTGLGVLFSGASTAVIVMASALEFAKLVTASYLEQKWRETTLFLKVYLTSAVFILMLITSAGIFGYLSNAFQQQNIKLQQVDREILVFQTKIDQNTAQIEQLSTQISESNKNQTTILGKGKVNNRLLRSIDNRDRQIGKINDKIAKLQEENAKNNEEINKIRLNNLDLEKEVGGFKFVAQAFDVELDKVVKWFMFLIVFVFDPLAIALVIALNKLLKENNPKTEEKSELVEKNYEVYGDNGKKSTKSEDIINSLENYLNNTPKEQLDADFSEIDEMVSNNQQMGLYEPPFDNPLADDNVIFTEEDKKALEPEITDEILLNLQTDFSKRGIDVDGDGSIDGYDTDGDGMIDIIRAEHPSRAEEVKTKLPYYARPDFNWSDRKNWINDQNAVNYWIKHIKPSQYPEDFSGKSY
jgi:hypothetical protein